MVWLTSCVKGYIHNYKTASKIGKLWNCALLGQEAWLIARYTLLPNLIVLQFINEKEPSKVESAGASTFGVGAWLTSKNKPPPRLYYHVKFNSSASKGLCVNRRKPTKLGSAGLCP